MFRGGAINASSVGLTSNESEKLTKSIMRGGEALVEFGTRSLRKNLGDGKRGGKIKATSVTIITYRSKWTDVEKEYGEMGKKA